MRVILVPVSDRPESIVALKKAFNLGKRLGASIKGCHIRNHDYSPITLPSNDTDLSNQDSNNKSQSAKDIYIDIAKSNQYKFIKKQKNRIAAMWLEKKGSPDKLFSIMGPVSDLIVVSRPAKKGKSVARDFMMSALLKSSKPVLVLPQLETKKIGKNISIAWNQSSHAALAVTAALPLLKRAKQVNIIRSGPENAIGPKSSHLKKYLRSWGIKAQCISASGENDTRALLNAYEQLESDLLVMRGYSHSRLKQRIFGGVTEYMLNQANIPVFMLHTG